MNRKDSLLINLRLEKSIYDQLAEIKEKLGANKMQDVFRFALTRLIEDYKTTGILIKHTPQVTASLTNPD